MLKTDFGMKRYTIIMGLIVCFTFAIVGRAGFAQAPASGSPQAPTGPSVDSISTTYREPKKDPFYDERLQIKKQDAPGKIKIVEALPWPSFEEREAAWKERRQKARESNQPEPAISEKYLIDELAIMGVFKKPEGQGIFLKPKTASTTMIFATVGQKFWNGSIRRIEKDQIEVEELTKLSNNTTKSDRKTLRYTRGKN